MEEPQETTAQEANLTREEARARATRVADVDYTLLYRLFEGSETYQGEATVEFTTRAGEGPVFLDFLSSDLRTLELDGAPLERSCFDGTRIHLPEDRVGDGRHTLRCSFENRFDRGGAGFYRFVDPADDAETMYTNSEPYDAHRFLPSFDQPDLKATYALEVEAPLHWAVVSNTREERTEELDEGHRVRHVFPRTERFSTYLFHLSAGRFRVYEDPDARIPSRVLCRESLAGHLEPDLPAIFETTRRGFDFYEQYFAVEYPFGKYDQIFCPDFMTGAMENVGAVTIADSRYVFRHRATTDERLERDMVILHELAHMWFGNLVTMRWWDGLWLNESFATYMSFLAVGECTDHETGWTYFDDHLRTWAIWQDELPTTHPIEAEVVETKSAFDNFDGITYGKGCCVLKQLAFRLGPETFRKGVALYLDRFRFGNTENHDFTDALAEAAGTDLTDWCRGWLFASGVNVLRPELAVEDGRITRLVLRQERGNGAAVLRGHHLRLGLLGSRAAEEGAIEQVSTLHAVISGEETEVAEAVGLPAPAILHPNLGGEAYAKVRLDEASTQVAVERFADIADPSVRASLLDVLWSEVHDAELPAQRFLDLARRLLPGVTHGPVLSKLVTAVGNCLGRILDPGARAEPAAAFHRMAKDALAAGDLDENARLLWFQLLRATAHSDEDLDTLEALLDEEGVYPGLHLDQRQRWSLVAHLARRRGAAALPRLEAEEARDDSDQGARLAFAARCGMPEPQAKEAAWTRFLEDEESSIEFLKVGFRAFHQPDQEEALAPFARRYLDCLDDYAARHSSMTSSAFARMLFPSYHTDEAFLAEVERRLEAGRVPDVMVRPVTESLDDVRRLVRVRAAAAHHRV